MGVRSSVGGFLQAYVCADPAGVPTPACKGSVPGDRSKLNDQVERIANLATCAESFARLAAEAATCAERATDKSEAEHSFAQAFRAHSAAADVLREAGEIHRAFLQQVQSDSLTTKTIIEQANVALTRSTLQLLAA